MAKGLFAVYRDAGAPAPSSSSVGRALAAPPNKALARRKDAHSARGEGTRALGEKENVDPLLPLLGRPGGKDALAAVRGKKPALGAKRVDAEGGKGVRALPPRTVGGKVHANAVCTGTLRTRVLPDLPPLEADADVERVVPAVPPAPPRTADVRLDGDNNERSPRTSGDGSFLSASTGSASDSGYARSSSARASDAELDLDIAAAFADEDNGDRSAELERAVDDREADRRARALTESPLAEITQAFTGLGRFSLANMSPSPAVRPSSSRPAPPARTRSSPTKVPSLSALPARMAPYGYSTTATTKRAKPAPPAGAPGEKPARASLRF
ncbi:hypothetical protein JCM10449v2_003775 [Rhodotorula kratochvilovae]